MKNHLIAFLLLLTTSALFAQTANDPSSYLPYTGRFAYGVNQGWYSTNWTSQQEANLAADLGVRTLRIPLEDDHLSSYGLFDELPDVKYYQSLGDSDLTAFVGKPSDAHRDAATYFAGLYQPIWINGKVNPANTFAQYMYNVVSTYGPFIKFWEVVNEPDFTYSAGGWMGDQDPKNPASWFSYNPTASDLFNLHAPVTVYVRLLRVAWEVIKKYSPNSYVCTGGIGAKSFLDAVLRNNDGADGLKGGAYFDVISFHSYPQYQLRQWSNATGGFVYFRHSDAAINMGFLWVQHNMDSIAALYGYDGKTYPKKQFICTETNVGRVMDNDSWGSADGSVNYLMKALVASQKVGVKQLYVYQLGDGATAAQFDQMGLYKWIGSSHPGDALQLNPEGIAFKTMASLLQGCYDSSVHFPDGIDGGAFKKADGSYVYVLWAKTTTDLSEAASASYSLPNAAIRKEWDYSQTGNSTPVSGTIQLSSRPTFFEMAPPKKILTTIRIYTDGSTEVIK